MTNSQAFLTEETSLSIDEWMLKHRKETGNKIIKPNAINLILEEHFELQVEELRNQTTIKTVFPDDFLEE